VTSRFEENLINAVNHFKCCGCNFVRSESMRLRYLVGLLLFPRAEEWLGGQSKTFGHGADRVQAWTLLPTFHIPQEVSSEYASSAALSRLVSPPS